MNNQATTNNPGLLDDGMCDDHGKFGCEQCALPGQLEPDPPMTSNQVSQEARDAAPRDYSPEERALLNSLGGYQKVFNAFGDATSVYAGQPGSGVNTSVWKFIKSIFPHVEQQTLARAGGGREVAFVRDDLCNVEFGTVPDCDCPHEHWHFCGVCLDVHIEEDGSGHSILGNDDWQLEVRGVANLDEMRAIAFAWAKQKYSLHPTDPLTGQDAGEQQRDNRSDR